MATLKSSAFTDDPVVRARLQKCADNHAFNIHQGRDRVGVWVSAIQGALINIFGEEGQLTGITPDELESRTYGPTTAAAVFRFKNDPFLNNTGGKILGFGQTVPDNIVGRQTIVALDFLMAGATARQGTATKLQDVFVQILGADPNGPRAGQPTEAGFPQVGAPRPDEIAARVNTTTYLETHRPVVMVNFHGGGGTANPASDPTAKVVAAVTTARSAAVAAGDAAGRVVVVGFSIGGRGAVTVCNALITAGIPVDYLGLVDAAFSGQGDPARVFPVGATVLENIYEAVHHFVLAKFPGFEFHGDVGGQKGVSLDVQPFFKTAKAEDEAEFNKASSDRKKQQIADDHFNKVHDRAVRDNYPIIIRRAIARLTG
jgi:hypothetical protein